MRFYKYIFIITISINLSADLFGENYLTVKGKITNLLGDELPLVSVSLRKYQLPYSAELIDQSHIYSVQSDSQGEFLFRKVPEGLYFFRAESPGWKTGEIPKILICGSKEYVIDLGLGLAQTSPPLTVYKINGEIADQQGKTIESASVCLFAVFNPSIRYCTRTNNNGEFYFEILEQALFALFASDPGFKGTIILFDLSEKNEFYAKIVLDKK